MLKLEIEECEAVFKECLMITESKLNAVYRKIKDKSNTVDDLQQKITTLLRHVTFNFKDREKYGIFADKLQVMCKEDVGNMEIPHCQQDS